MIFVLTASSDWAFHKDNSHFPLFEEVLLFRRRIFFVKIRDAEVKSWRTLFHLSMQSITLDAL